MSLEEDYDRPPVTFVPAGADAKKRAESLGLVQSSEGYLPASILVADVVAKRSEVTVLDFGATETSVRYQIDGVWHAGDPMEREMGNAMLAAMKQLAGIDSAERRSRQSGSFATEYLKGKQKFRIASKNRSSGERVVLYLSWKKDPIETVAQLGMRERMQGRLKEILSHDEKGLLLVAARPKEGYTSAWRGVLSACDRLTRDFFVIEDESMVEEEVINFGSITFDTSKDENAFTPVRKLLLREPNVLAFNDLPDGKTMNGICELSAENDISVYVRVEGRNCIDAVRNVAALKASMKKFAELLNHVICMRAIRMLCTKCRIAYAPHPTLLEKLGLPPGRVAQLFKPMVYQPGMVDEQEEEILPCTECNGIGYKGLTGIFELLEVGDEMKKAIGKGAKSQLLKEIAVRHRHISMKQEGAVLIAKGTTSVEELQRVLSAK